MHIPEYVCWLSKFPLHQFGGKVLGIPLHGILEALVLRHAQTEVTKFTRHPVQTEKDVVGLDVKVTEVVVMKMTQAL